VLADPAATVVADHLGACAAAHGPDDTISRIRRSNP